MQNLIFCLNATVPIFLLMVLGFFFKKIGIFTESFTKTMNSFVFKVALPVLLFQDLSGEDFLAVWDGKFVLFCFLATLLSIALAILISYLWKDRSVQGEFAQAAYRSSAALLGIGFIQNIYGTSGMAPLMIIGTVPLYNIMAVVILSFLKPNRGKLDKKLLLNTLKGIVTNPIILGIAIGMLWSLCKTPQPLIMEKTVKYIANLATPLGLMALGASVDYRKTLQALRPALCASGMKLILFCMLFLPLAVRMGYVQDKLVGILVMLGSPTTVSCFVMAKSMGHEGTLSSSTVMITTFFSAFTLTFWLYVLRVMGLV